MRKLRVATRGSRLALWQTEHVLERLRSLVPAADVEVVRIRTTGDVIQDVPLSTVGSSAFFTKEIETALLEGRADFAVHSLKDLASKDVPGLCVAAVLPREDPRDALVARPGASLAALPAGARVGTSSVRRKALLASVRPDLELAELRGNVPTRVKKLEDGRYDAIVLASAGLIRLGMRDRIAEALDVDTFVPPAGQGAVAVQARSDDREVLDLLGGLEHPETRVCVDAERAFLAAFDVGCQAPVGVHVRCVADVLSGRAVVAAPDGGRVVSVTAEGPRTDPAGLGLALVERMRAEGGDALLAAARGRGGAEA